MNELSSLIFLLLRKSPLILVLVAGLIFAVIRWKRHPRSSLFAAIGMALYLISIFVVSSLYYLLPGQLERFGVSASSGVFVVIQLVDDLVYCGVLILLITAAFTERSPKDVIHA